MSDRKRATKVSTAGILEALLFAAEEPLPLSQLAELIDTKPGATREELELLRLQYEQSDGAVQLIEIAKGYRLATKPQYAPYVRELRRPRTQRLSRAGLEVLSIVSYRQPVTGPEIDHIRGVNSSGSIDTLLERGLIEVAGRKETPGRPRLYRTTQAFLDQFGLADLTELPQLPEAELAELSEALFASGELADVSREEIEQQLAVQEVAAQAAAEAAALAEPEQPTEEADPAEAPAEAGVAPEAGVTPEGEAPAEEAATDASSDAPAEPTPEEPTDTPDDQQVGGNEEKTGDGPFVDGFID